MGRVKRAAGVAGKVDVLYADPPWQYRDKCAAGERGVDFKYATMSDDDILALGYRVHRVMADDSWLFLWATPPRLPIAFRVLETWGFEFVTVGFSWIKVTKNGKLFWGMGTTTRANPEYVLIGKRGKPKRASASVHSVVLADVKGHSEKPFEVRDRIEQLVGPGKRMLELFARSRKKGWMATGLEFDGMDVREYLDKLAGGQTK